MTRQGDDDFAPESLMAERLKEHGIDLSLDPYLMHRLGVVERSSGYCRSLSPKRVEKEGTVDRGKYEWISSRDEMGKTYELRDNVVGNDAKNTGLRYEYENIGRGGDIHDDYEETERILRATEHEILRQKSMALDPDLKSKYVESGRSLPSDPKLGDSDRLEVKGAWYPDPHLMDKLIAMEEMHGRRERLEFHSKNISYPVEYTSQPNDLSCTCHINGNSTGISRGDYSPSFQDDMDMQKNDRPLTSAEIGHQFLLDEYREESAFHAGIQQEMRSYNHDRSRASRTNDKDFYLYPRTWIEKDYSHRYLSEGLNRRRDSRQLNVSPSRVLDSATKKIDISQSNLIGCSSLDDHSPRTKLALKYLPSGTFPATRRQDDFYQDSRDTYAEKRNYGEREMPSLYISRVGEASRGILNHGSDNDAASNIYFEKWRKSSGGESHTEIHGHGVGTEKVETCVHGTDNELGRSLKRKYSLEDEMIMHNSSGIMPRKLTTINGTSDVSGVQDRKDQDASPLLEDDIEQSRRLWKASYEKEKVNPVAASHNLLSSHNPMEQGQKLLITQDVPWKKLKFERKPSSLSWHNMKYSVPKNVWIRGNIDKQMEVNENKVKESKSTLVDSEKSLLTEGFNKFDLQVQKNFLIFTKKVNEDLCTRKSYKEKGWSGGLFCIACRKRQFRDAQSLGAHCFMSQKLDLKAKHLGLLKAICVLMGWNTIVGPNVTAWMPEPISRSNASAQREDLILWPPTVIVHGSQARQVKALRKIEDFLRGEGFSVSKIKICLGKPANGSVVVVKFLATYPGLKDAEKLHDYFIKKGHGREDFNHASDKYQNSKPQERYKEIDELELYRYEHALYGYMAIAEDLGEVDKDTSSRCLIKSKKEIHDFVDAPVYTSTHQLS